MTLVTTYGVCLLLWLRHTECAYYLSRPDGLGNPTPTGQSSVFWSSRFPVPSLVMSLFIVLRHTEYAYYFGYGIRRVPTTL